MNGKERFHGLGTKRNLSGNMWRLANLLRLVHVRCMRIKPLFDLKRLDGCQLTGLLKDAATIPYTEKKAPFFGQIGLRRGDFGGRDCILQPPMRGSCQFFLFHSRRHRLAVMRCRPVRCFGKTSAVNCGEWRRSAFGRRAVPSPRKANSTRFAFIM